MSDKSIVKSLCTSYVFIILLFTIIQTSIDSVFANHLTKSSESISNMSKDRENRGLNRGLNNILLEGDDLELALKKFIEEWDRTHGTTHSNVRDNRIHQSFDKKSNTTTDITNKQLIDETINRQTNSSSQLFSEWQSDSPGSSESGGDGRAESGGLELDGVVPPVWAKPSKIDIQDLIARNERKHIEEDNNQRFDSDFDSDDEYTSQSGNCTRCVLHEEAKSRRLETIKVNILNKLGLKSAPNITGKALPRIPPLHHLLDRYNMLGDDPRVSGPQLLHGFVEEQDHTVDRDEEDLEEFFVNAERSISFAQKRKSKDKLFSC